MFTQQSPFTSALRRHVHTLGGHEHASSIDCVDCDVDTRVAAEDRFEHQARHPGVRTAQTTDASLALQNISATTLISFHSRPGASARGRVRAPAS